MKHPTLSVGMPNFNHARYLPAALDALVSQSYRPLEIIVIDDASTDGSVKIISAYARRHRNLRLIRHERNRGINTTLSELLETAAGDYFVAPAADDLILPGFWEKSMKLLEQHPGAGLCSAQIHVMDENGKITGLLADDPLGQAREGYYITPQQGVAIIHRQGFWVHGNTAIFRRRALLDAGGYREELGYHHDGYMHQLLALRHGACFIPQALAVERQMPGTFSSRSKKNPAEMRRIREVALGYMRGEHREAFPAGFVRRWAARWTYWRSMDYSETTLGEWRTGLKLILDTGGRRRRLLYGFAAAAIRGASVFIRSVALLLRATAAFMGQCAAARSALARLGKPIKG